MKIFVTSVITVMLDGLVGCLMETLKKTINTSLMYAIYQ